jgi:uncharacterized surface protein with fasciclin (FAS1) repeats
MHRHIDRLLAISGMAALAIMVSACEGTALQRGTSEADNTGAAAGQPATGEGAPTELPAVGGVQTTATLIAAVETIETEEPVVEEVQATPWTPGGVAEVLQNDPHFSQFVAVLSQGRVFHIIADTGPFTIFAPTDEAWAGVAEVDIATLVTDPVNAQDFLLSYVVEGQMSPRIY